MSDDIVALLRRNPLYIPTSRINSFGRPQMGFELTSFNLIAADEIERLRNERDEARRMYLASACSEDEIIHEMNRRGWDCFKEER